MLNNLAKDGTLDIYFISGIHGVGKGTLCNHLKSLLNLDVHSCSDIIKANSGYVEQGKGVQDTKGNQSALVVGLHKLVANEILLDGHFCLLDKAGGIITLDYQVFDDILPKKIVTVTCDSTEVRNRLLARDGVCPDELLLAEFQIREVKQAVEFSKSRKIPHYTYKSGDSVEALVEWLRV